MSRFEELKSYIAALPADIQAILTPVLHDIVYAEEMLQKFRDNPKTKSNAAMYKAYRQTKQIYQNDVKSQYFDLILFHIIYLRRIYLFQCMI